MEQEVIERSDSSSDVEEAAAVEDSVLVVNLATGRHFAVLVKFTPQKAKINLLEVRK